MWSKCKWEGVVGGVVEMNGVKMEVGEEEEGVWE